MTVALSRSSFFFFNDTATTEIYTLSLHDALPISMILLAITIGLLVIFLTMYTTVIERTRDIGVLKSLGANHWFVIRALLSESAALCVLGIGAGIGLSYVVRAGFLWKFPTLTISITSGWILRAAGIALLGALFGASYPAWMASRKHAVEALSYD